MKKYKLIKIYPGSPKLGTIVEQKKDCYKPINEEYVQLYYFLIIEDQPEYWEEIIEKDYEILSIMPINEINFKDIIFAYNCNNLSNYLIKGNYKILSIKRLSDGEIFTVGDSLTYGVITQLQIGKDNSTIWLDFKASGGYWKITDLKHIKKPLFTTEDGVDVFKGTIIYPVNIKYLTHSASYTVNTGNSCLNKNYKDFSTKEAAEEYILINKPCLSINEIATVVSLYSTAKLKELVKTKL